MKQSFKPAGICANAIDFEVQNGVVKNVKFYGGCPGNHLGIERLVEGMKVEDVIDRLSGVTCGHRATSCPDQLACALKAVAGK